MVVLAENFLAHYNRSMNKHVKGLSSVAKQKLLGHHWPGNVRELRNVIERAVILKRRMKFSRRKHRISTWKGACAKLRMPRLSRREIVRWTKSWRTSKSN